MSDAIDPIEVIATVLEGTPHADECRFWKDLGPCNCQIVKLEKAIATLRAREAARRLAVEACRFAGDALDNICCVHVAPDQCDETAVEKAQHWLSDRGATLAVWADVNMVVKAALAANAAAEAGREPEADEEQPQPDTCHECGELSVGCDDLGTPYCAAHYRSRMGKPGATDGA